MDGGRVGGCGVRGSGDRRTAEGGACGVGGLRWVGRVQRAQSRPCDDPRHPWAHAARRVEAYADYVRLRGIQDTAFTDDFRRSYALLDDRADFLFTYGTALRELGRYNDSNAVLRQGTRVSGDPMFHVVMGNNYHDLGVTEKAEETYRKASALLPSRMYPLYRLMKLYEATGQKRKAERTARRIAAFRAKVDSPAVRQMRREARELIP